MTIDTLPSCAGGALLSDSMKGGEHYHQLHVRQNGEGGKRGFGLKSRK